MLLVLDLLDSDSDVIIPELAKFDRTFLLVFCNRTEAGQVLILKRFVFVAIDDFS